MYKLLAILTIILTLCICVTKPQMHRAVLVYDSDYTIVEPKTETEVDRKLPSMVQTEQVKTTKQAAEVPKTETKIFAKQTPTQTKTPVKTSTTTTVKSPVQNTQTQTQTAQNTQTVKIPEKTLQAINSHNAQTTKTIKIDPKPVLMTEEQEQIAWNIWRSNLQNSIMRDVRLPIMPQGTVFKFTFNVDKYGRVSNVQTYSTNPKFTPYAIQYIAPVIRSYQGKSILNFPAGSSRTATRVEGGWKIADVAIYSSPSDYNDTETKVKVK